MPSRVEKIVRKGEIACYKQFLLFSQCFPELYICQNAALCGNRLYENYLCEYLCKQQILKLLTFASTLPTNVLDWTKFKSIVDLTLSQTTNFRFFQTEKSLQTTILILMKMAESSPNEKKRLWEKEKLLVTSNFSFSHSVSKRLVQQTHKNQVLFGKELKKKKINFQ